MRTGTLAQHVCQIEDELKKISKSCKVHFTKLPTRIEQLVNVHTIPIPAAISGTMVYFMSAEHCAFDVAAAGRQLCKAVADGSLHVESITEDFTNANLVGDVVLRSYAR